jgi:hypothetical protein
VVLTERDLRALRLRTLRTRINHITQEMETLELTLGEGLRTSPEYSRKFALLDQKMAEYNSVSGVVFVSSQQAAGRRLAKFLALPPM